MSRRRNQAGLPLYLGIAAGLGAVWLLLKTSSSSSGGAPAMSEAQLNAALEADPNASIPAGTVLPGGSVVLQ